MDSMEIIEDSVYLTVGVEPGAELPAYAWPGGYPIVYSDSGDMDGWHMGEDCVCPKCANKHDWSGAHITSAFVLWEGPAERCANCNAEIESAYGDPNIDQDEEHAK